MMVYAKKLTQPVNYVGCDRCEKWDMFENVSKALGIAKFDEDKIAKLDYICRECEFEEVVSGRFDAIDGKISAMEKSLDKLEELESFKKELEDVKEMKKELKVMKDLKKVVKESDNVQKEKLKELEKDLDVVKKGMKEATETKIVVDNKWKTVENKLKMVDDLKKGIEEVKDLTKGINQVESMKEQLQELTVLTATQSDTTKAMEKFVEVKFKGKAKEMKAEVVESFDIEQRKCNVIVHGLEEESVALDDLGSRGQEDHAKVMKILEKGLALKAGNHIVKVSRIGKPRTDRPRLLKVELKTIEGRNEVLKRAKDLRHSGDFQKVFIVPDLTRKQQEVDKDLRDQL